jgi:hypothetical protein
MKVSTIYLMEYRTRTLTFKKASKAFHERNGYHEAHHAIAGKKEVGLVYNHKDNPHEWVGEHYGQASASIGLKSVDDAKQHVQQEHNDHMAEHGRYKAAV